MSIYLAPVASVELDDILFCIDRIDMISKWMLFVIESDEMDVWCKTRVILINVKLDSTEVIIFETISHRKEHKILILQQ